MLLTLLTLLRIEYKKILLGYLDLLISDLTKEEFPMKEFKSYQYGSVMSVKCWLPEMGFNWDYRIKCQVCLFGNFSCQQSAANIK